MSEVLLAGTVMQAGRMVKRYRKDKEMVRNQSSRSFRDLHYVHEVLSCLTKGVYARDEGHANSEEYWQESGYEPVDDFDLGDETDRKQVAVPGAKYARLMLFQRRRGPVPNGGEGRLRVEDNQRGGHVQHMYMNVRWPKYVVAIRGTIMTKEDDLMNDLRIFFDTICQEAHLYEPIMRLLKAIYDTYGDDDVWVAGHSLGATLGLIATRRLASDEGIVLSGHFFNPPNISLDVLAKKVVTGAMNGLAEGAAVIPVFGRPTRWLIRGSCSIATSVAERVARSAFKLVFSEKFEGAERGHRTLLALGYRPHFYVNPKDFICNEFIAHFQGSDPPAVSNAVPFTQLFDAQSCHLIPSAYLHTNHWASGFPEAHKLHQWFLYDPVNLTSQLAGGVE